MDGRVSLVIGRAYRVFCGLCGGYTEYCGKQRVLYSHIDNLGTWLRHAFPSGSRYLQRSWGFGEFLGESNSRCAVYWTDPLPISIHCASACCVLRFWWNRHHRLWEPYSTMTSPVTDKETIISRIRSSRETLASFGVLAISLFGSFVRSEEDADSDVDILVEFLPEKHTFDSFMDLSFFLEDLLGRKVDLLTPESLSPHIGPHILQEAQRVSIAA